MPYKIEIEYRDYGDTYRESGRPWRTKVTTPSDHMHLGVYNTRWGAIWAAKRWVRGHKRAVKKVNNPYVAEVE